MVCDSRIQTDSAWWPGEKVYRVGAVLIGGSGDNASVTQFVEWYKSNRAVKPKFNDFFVALVLSEAGLQYWSQTLIPDTIERGFHAVGSGGNCALGAMMAGASCLEAVRIACQVDTNSGGDLRTHKLTQDAQ